MKRVFVFLFTFSLLLGEGKASLSHAVVRRPITYSYSLDYSANYEELQQNLLDISLYDAYITYFDNQNGRLNSAEFREFSHYVFEKKYATIGLFDLNGFHSSLQYCKYNYAYIDPVLFFETTENTIPDQTLESILNSLKITAKTSEKQCADKIAAWIYKKFRYSLKEAGNFNVKSQFNRKKMACHGFASLFYGLCKKCGLDVHYVETMYHAYNYITIRGKRYYYDVSTACQRIHATKKKKKKLAYRKRYIGNKKKPIPDRILFDF